MAAPAPPRSGHALPPRPTSAKSATHSTGPTLRARARRLAPWLALLPLAAIVLAGYLGPVLWTARVSVSGSRTFPQDDFVGLAQYARLLDNERWLQAWHNLLVYGSLYTAGCLALGVLLAIAIDRQVRGEAWWRTIFLYPYALSFVATGLVWQWLLHPEAGLPTLLQRWGLVASAPDWITNPDTVIYTLVVAGTWQAAGLVMALVLAGLRGIDDELWQAARLEGIPTWRVYGSIVLPMLRPTLATVAVLLFTAVVKVYDTVVAMTQGGPGTASDVPAKFIMDHLFGRANLALASAGAVLLLASALLLAAPVLYARHRAARSLR